MVTKALTRIEGSVLQPCNTYPQHQHTVQAFTAETKEVRLQSGNSTKRHPVVLFLIVSKIQLSPSDTTNIIIIITTVFYYIYYLGLFNIERM